MDVLLKRCLQLRGFLKKSLGEDYPKYMSSVRDWVRKRKTRNELDSEVLSYLEQPAQKVHSQFLLTLSKLCCGRLSLRVDIPRPKPVDVIPDEDQFLLYKRLYTDTNVWGVELIKARFYLSAWDKGLSNVDPKVSRMLYWAMRSHIKDIIQSAILHRPAAKSKRISSLDVWQSLVRTNCDRPTVLLAEQRNSAV